MSEKDNVKQKPSSSSSATSETVLRGAAKFREKMQQRKGAKSSLRAKIKSAVKVNNNNFEDKVQSVKTQEGDSHSHRSHDTRRHLKKKARKFIVPETNNVKPKGKNYPTPKSSREPKMLNEDQITEVLRRRKVYDTKVGGRSVKGGFQFRKPPRLGSDNGRRRMDRIYSVDDSDEEDEREGAYGYGTK